MENPRPTTAPDLPPIRASLMRSGLRFLAVFIIALLLYEATIWVMETADTMLPERSAGMVRWSLLIFLVAFYAVLMAVPFVPGIEIGISLLLIGGATIAPIEYFATVAGLSLAYLVGFRISYDRLHRILADLRLRRVCDLLADLKAMDQDTRLHALKDRLPSWVHPLIGRGRYVLLIALFNVPGNFVLGGGGGIALLAGVSRVFAPGPTLLSIAIAVLPVPFGVWLLGTSVLTGF
ncbi:MAG: hypothetical protein HRU32_15325 [Rhodobacteraceae bacterium]|nr:hypothetical protein [Paracoccaceae bacterium]